jgi:hypothetical protein
VRELDRTQTHLDEVEDSAGRKLMKTPSPASIEPLAFGSNAVPPCRLAPSTIADERQRPSRSAYSVFRPIGMFFSGLADSSAYQGISSAREISIIFTANGPLMYRWESHNRNPSAW